MHNRGTSPVPAGSVTRLAVGDRTLDGATGAIAAGATAEVAVSGTWTATGGASLLTATADATDIVGETDESNNILTRSIVVGRGAAVPYTEYEAEDGNTPQADARRLFDESHALLGSTYPAGTVFRLQRDTAAFYIVDLEQVAPAAGKPAGCVSITEYGAVPNDGIDDTDALQRAVTDDQNGRIDCVWVPPPLCFPRSCKRAAGLRARHDCCPLSKA